MKAQVLSPTVIDKKKGQLMCFYKQLRFTVGL